MLKAALQDPGTQKRVFRGYEELYPGEYSGQKTVRIHETYMHCHEYHWESC